MGNRIVDASPRTWRQREKIPTSGTHLAFRRKTDFGGGFGNLNRAFRVKGQSMNGSIRLHMMQNSYSMKPTFTALIGT